MNIVNLIVYLLTVITTIASPVCLIIAIYLLFKSSKNVDTTKKHKLRKMALWIFLSPIIVVAVLFILESILSAI